MATANPQFPHTFSISRDVRTGTNANPTVTPTVILSGICRFYPDNTGGERGGVKVADYKLSTQIDISDLVIGDKITCINGAMVVVGKIKLFNLYNLGNNIWFDIVKN